MAQGSKYAVGKYARAVCDFTGEAHDYKDMVIDPDTKLFVFKDDVDDPDPYRRLRSRQDAIALRHPRNNIDLEDSAANATGICLSQTPLAAGAMTMNGALVSGGVATLDTDNNSKQVIFTSVGDDRTVVFTIIGTVIPGGGSFTEQIGGANAGIAGSSNAYYTVTSVSVSKATAGAVTVGTRETGDIFDTVPLA